MWLVASPLFSPPFGVINPLPPHQLTGVKVLGIDSPATHARKDILQFPIQRRVEIDCLSSSRNAQHFYSSPPDIGAMARSLLRGCREMGTGLSCWWFPPLSTSRGESPFYPQEARTTTPHYGSPMRLPPPLRLSWGEAVPSSHLVSSH